MIFPADERLAVQRCDMAVEIDSVETFVEALLLAAVDWAYRYRTYSSYRSARQFYIAESARRHPC